MVGEEKLAVRRTGCFWRQTIISFLFKPVLGVFLIGVTEAAIGVLAYLVMYALLEGWAEQDIASRETLWLLLALAVTAAVDGRILGISVRLLISLSLIAGAARLGGLPVSALLGSGLALAGLLFGESTDYVVLTVLCATLTGVLSGSSFALIVWTALAVLLSRGGNIDAYAVRLAAASLGSGAAAALIPARFLRHLARIIPGTPLFRMRQASYTERVREIINERMSDQLVVLEELAHTRGVMRTCGCAAEWFGRRTAYHVSGICTRDQLPADWRTKSCGLSLKWSFVLLQQFKPLMGMRSQVIAGGDAPAADFAAKWQDYVLA